MLLALVLAMTNLELPNPTNQVLPAPSARQLEWQKLEYYAFVHFGPNTFSDQEWGHGTENPNIFNPTALDCRQWVKTFKDAGMKQVIITAKHHDGFCLWPSKFSKHTVAQSNWKSGKGDVLRELRNACNEYGLKMGVYLSPWDRNHPDYGTPHYNKVFAQMLKEVLTSYGPIYEVWFDGANGEGSNGKKQVYDWNLFISTVRKHAPKAVIFSDNGPDTRWVGNEDGIAGETCWSTIDRSSPKSAIGAADQKYLNAGDARGKDWVPAECDVSIRPGWFYHASQDNQVKSPEKLLDLWEKSVGRNGSLLLNVPPDRRGLIHENDVKALMGFKKLRDATYRVRIPQVPNLVDRIMLREDVSKGHAVRKFHVEAKVNGAWQTVAKGSNIGAKRILPIDPISPTDVRVIVDEHVGKVKLMDTTTHATAIALQNADKDKRMKWWREARFGMFIHWGLYAIPAGEWRGKNYEGASEWLMYTAKIPVADYKPLQPQFNPYKFDAKRWVQIAKDAGMKYIVITSKHHDGFGLFDSKQTDWDIMNTPFKRDALKELAKACKEGGIKLCFYHSIMDWTHPDYGQRRPWDPRPGIPTNMDRYTQYMKAQLKELLTNYGDIGILWFDGEWEPEAWTHERGVDLYNYVRSLQPKIIVNNRVDVHRSGMAGMSASDQAVGDYGTPEQEIPANGMPGTDWESCMTMNGSWGFHKNDHNWKSAVELFHNVIDCASKGGNYLLNVGPNALGEIPEPSVQRLAEMGEWMRENGEAIYKTQAGPFPRALDWGRVTRKGNKLYLHLFDNSKEAMDLPGLSLNVTKAYRLKDKVKCEVKKSPDGWTFVNPNPFINIRQSMPTVFVLEFTGTPKVVTPPLKQARDGSVLLRAIDAQIRGTTAAYEASKECIGFWTNAADVVTWEFDVTQPGSFEAVAEIACEPASAGTEVQFAIGRSRVNRKIGATKGWTDFVRLPLGTVQISTKGKVQVTVKAVSKPSFAVMNLRSISLTPVAN